MHDKTANDDQQKLTANNQQQ